MAWRVAKALEVLLDEVNAAAPQRSKVSDGSIGDAAHASRTSDHNPYVIDSRGVGVVRARDFTDDPPQHNASEFAEFLRESRDPRIRYVIDQGRMFASYDTPTRPAWAWGPYVGINAHKQHTHVSVREEARFYDDDRPWGWSDREDDMKPEDWDRLKKITRDAAEDAVKPVRQRLNEVEAAVKALGKDVPDNIRQELDGLRRAARESLRRAGATPADIEKVNV